MKKLIIVVILAAVIGLGAAVVNQLSYTEFGSDIPFMGLNLRDASTNLQPGWATECNNFIFDIGGALHVRPGLDQFNATTRQNAFTFLSSYVDPSGQGWYVAFNGDTLYIPSSTDTSWTGSEVVGSILNYSTVALYNDGATEDWVRGGASGYNWRKILGAGDGLKLVLSDSADTFYTIEAILEDSLIVVDRGNLSADLTSQGYYIQTSYGDLNCTAVAQGILFLGTSNGLYKWDGNKLTPLDSLNNSFYGYDVTDITWDYNNYATSANNRNATDARLKWKLSTWRGSGSAPAFANGTADGLWAIGKSLYACLNPYTANDSLPTGLTDHYYTATYKVLNVVKTGGINYIYTNGAALMPERDSVAQIALYDTQIDSSSYIVFTADSIVVDSVCVTCGVGWNEIWALYNRYYPADSSWDSTRFMTGDWFAAGLSEMAYPGYSGDEYPVVGMCDSAGWIYTIGGPYRTTQTELPELYCTFVRHPKAGADGAAYTDMTVYKDRLWVITADAPDQLKYSQPFKPDSLSLYQVIGLDVADGEQIIDLFEMYGELHILTTSSVYTLSGATIADFYLRKVVSDIGCSAPKTSISLGDRQFFAHKTGFYLYTPGQPLRISDMISPIIEDSINWEAARDVMCAGYYKNHLWISYPSGSSATNNRTLVYSLLDQRWGNESFTAAAYHRIPNSLDENKFMVSLTDSGAMCFLTGTSDGGDSIQAEYQTGNMNFGIPELKQILEYYAVYDAVVPVVVEVTRNDTLLYASEITKDATALTFKERRISLQDKDLHGRYLKVGIKLHSTTDASMYKLTLGMISKGKRGYDQ